LPAVEEQRHPHLDHQARTVDAAHTARLRLDQPPEAEPVPESAKKNEPRSVREVARAVAQPQRTRIALHVRPGRNMMRAHRLVASACEGYFWVEVPTF